MKFQRTELIARIDEQIEARKKAAEVAYQDAIKAQAQERADWLEKYSEPWTLFANRVKDKIRKGRPILHDDIPAELADSKWNPDPTFFTPQGRRTPNREASIADLETLRRALEAVTDEVVTTTGLREIGFKDIARLFRGGAR